MNERIREFAEQARIYTNSIHENPWGRDSAWQATYNEKFAELIVRECADVAADHEALDIYEEIREHFGVEE